MCQVNGVANMHVATTVGPQVLDQIVLRRIGEIGTLPASIRERVDRQAGEIALVEALRRSGDPGADPGEPSWSVLGALIRETRFVQIWRRLNFMKTAWSVPVDDFWTEARASVKDHPFRPSSKAWRILSPRPVNPGPGSPRPSI